MSSLSIFKFFAGFITLIRNAISLLLYLFLSAKLIVQILCIISIVSFGFGAYKLLYRGGVSVTTSTLLEYKPADKLFTTFAYVPFLGLKAGVLKRDTAKISINPFLDPREIKPVAKGYCRTDYNIGIGYDNVQGLITDHKRNACKDNLVDLLPEPKIISVNAESSKSFGDYSTEECHLIQSDSARRSEILVEYMKELQQWEYISKTSKTVLASFIRLFCEK